MPILLLLFLLYWYIMFNDTGQSLLSSNLSTTMSITPKVRLCSKCAHTFHDRNFYLGWDFCVCFLLLFFATFVHFSFLCLPYMYIAKLFSVSTNFVEYNCCISHLVGFFFIEIVVRYKNKVFFCYFLFWNTWGM